MPLYYLIEKMKTISKIMLLLVFLSCFCFAGKRYPEWFVHPQKYPKIVVGYNYRDVNLYSDAAATYCVLDCCLVKGELYQYSDTEKRYSDYYYYYDKNEFETILDSLFFLKTYVVNTFPLSLIAAFSMEKCELSDVFCDFNIMETPSWTEKNFYAQDAFYYGIGVYTSTGNDIDAWKTAEERSYFAIVTGYRTGITAQKILYKDEIIDYYEKEQVLHCQYSLKNLQICERYADKKNQIFYVLSRIDKSGIKAGELLKR